MKVQWMCFVIHITLLLCLPYCYQKKDVNILAEHFKMSPKNFIKTHKVQITVWFNPKSDKNS